MQSVTLFMKSADLHKKRELVCMDNFDLCMKSEIRYPRIMFIYTKYFL